MCPACNREQSLPISKILLWWWNDIHLIKNICSTFCEITEFEDLRFRFIIIVGATMHWSCCWQNYNVFFYPLILFAQYTKKDINPFYLFIMTSFAQHFTVFCIKYFFRKTHSTFLYSTYNSHVFLKKPASDFNTSGQTIHGNVSSIKSNLLFCLNNKIFVVVSSWTYAKWSITSSWFSCIW